MPRTLVVLGRIHERYGRLKLLDLPIRIYDHGYKITQLQHDLQVRKLDNLKSGAKYFR